jgi:hypothetical protein
MKMPLKVSSKFKEKASLAGILFNYQLDTLLMQTSSTEKEEIHRVLQTAVRILSASEPPRSFRALYSPLGHKDSNLYHVSRNDTPIEDWIYNNVFSSKWPLYTAKYFHILQVFAENYMTSLKSSRERFSIIYEKCSPHPKLAFDTIPFLHDFWCRRSDMLQGHLNFILSEVEGFSILRRDILGRTWLHFRLDQCASYEIVNDLFVEQDKTQ